ncbi:hypothetical protein HXX76_005809 [Chlamydomonas incerta]|uniref:CRAL-TRIO domain-containing protein n=1 Tax=Chlamydomonas incerta TaxID=51695 RepID=A0A835W3R2_CHLIN|nr:hypothetical protein HXX76_005809 [Chlamydomonas incerta]|eukprot:KAG2438205.1 hypothetical protein HXX76_005809 [Chlamydomonas incerta]
MHFFSHAPQPVQKEVEAFWYLNLTPEQQAAHDKFLAHLTDTKQLLAGHDDRYTLLRFLKARQWDVTKATVMYTNMTKWRAEHGTDKLYETFTFPEEDRVIEHYPHFYHMMDKFGRPLYVELLGQTDASKMLEHTSMERLLDYHIVEWERLKREILPRCSVLAGKPIITKNVILDLKGVSMKNFGHAAREILTKIAAIDQDYYCESLGQMFIINTPTVFRLIWAVVNPMLEERTRRKIIILGHDYMPTISQLIPEENLPACLGGKGARTDMKSTIGPWTDVELPAAGPAAAAAAAGSPAPAVKEVTAAAAPAEAVAVTAGNGSAAH